MPRPQFVAVSRTQDHPDLPANPVIQMAEAGVDEGE